MKWADVRDLTQQAVGGVSALFGLDDAEEGDLIQADGNGGATTVSPTPPGSASGTTVEVDLGTASWRGKFTITDASIGATSKVLCWQAPGPYTGKGTRADEAEMQPVQIIAVSPATGSATVYWQTPPMLAMSPVLNGGPKRDTVGATFDRLDNQRYPLQMVPTRIGKARGNVKFSYTVLV